MSPGNYMLPFVFQFPQGMMPSSFQGWYGRVKYVLEATLKRPWRFTKNRCHEINFRTKLDNFRILFMLPQAGQQKKKMSMFTSGNLSFKVLVDKKGYMPGETIRVQTIIDNSTSRDLQPYFKLQRKVTYKVKTITRTGDVILRAAGSPVPSNQQQTVTKELRIPRDLAPTNIFSSMLTVEYTLKVYMLFHLFHVPFAFDKEVIIPIFIMPPDKKGPVMSALNLLAPGQDATQDAGPSTQPAGQTSPISNPAASHQGPDLVPEHLPLSSPLLMSPHEANQQTLPEYEQETDDGAPLLYPPLESGSGSSPSALLCCFTP
ncbi:arrestin domain-containing protein 3-like [Engraulis encrasicolus]|uniref:arrestin domain-containing protein 3-like n=1 Tax=Engraulis encrasicolus TaxID=184585 RepID=UPI002FD79AFA